MPRLLVMQSVWGLDRCGGFDVWNRLEEGLETVIAAGFAGVGTNVARAERTAIVSRVMNAHGLHWEGQVLVQSADELARWIDRAAALGAHHLNVQIAHPLVPLAEGITLVGRLKQLADAAPLPVFFETHRGRLTNDLLYTLRLLEAYPDLPLTLDLSHYPVGQEMELPLSEPQRTAIDRLLRNTAALHGRVAGSHQVQIALAAPQHQPWLEQFKAWWRQAFIYWLSNAAEDGTFSFMCELGPPPYAITDLTGAELTDRWAEAKQMRAIALALWDEAIATAQASPLLPTPHGVHTPPRR